MKKIPFLAFLVCAALSVSFIGFTGCDDDDGSDGSPSETPSSDGGVPAISNNTPATVTFLESKTWELIYYGTSGSETAVLSGTSITATFSEGGVSGNSSCNSYNGSYTADNYGNLSIGSIGSTLMYCYPVERMVQERAYLDALGDATGCYKLGSNLEIRSGSGRHLMFH